jgi:hypothetical protein
MRVHMKIGHSYELTKEYGLCMKCISNEFQNGLDQGTQAKLCYDHNYDPHSILKSVSP